MRKKIITVLLACCMSASTIPAGTLDAYAAEEEAATEADSGTEQESTGETEEEPDVDVSAYLTITDDRYKDIAVTVAPEDKVTDQDVEDEIVQEASDAGLNTHYKDGVVKEGDTVNIDYVGTKDGKAFDGGTASGVDLTIGSNTYIDGFESGLIGEKVGKTVKLNLTFPDDYAAKELAGQDVVFTVTINYIEGAPVIDDDLADQLSGGKYTNVEDLRKSVRENLEQQNETNYNRELYSAIYSQLMELYPVTDYPQDFIDYYVNTSMSQLRQQAEQESESLDDMLQSAYRTDSDSMKDYFTTYAKSLLQQRIILGAIAKKENISLSDDDFQDIVKGYADQYGVSVDELLTYYNEKDIRESELENKVMEYLAGIVKITEQEETEADTEEYELETESPVEMESEEA